MNGTTFYFSSLLARKYGSYLILCGQHKLGHFSDDDTVGK